MVEYECGSDHVKAERRSQSPRQRGRLGRWFGRWVKAYGTAWEERLGSEGHCRAAGARLPVILENTNGKAYKKITRLEKTVTDELSMQFFNLLELLGTASRDC